MEATAPSFGSATPVKGHSTPPQPGTTARLLTRDSHDESGEMEGRGAYKTMSAASLPPPPPFAHVSRYSNSRSGADSTRSSTEPTPVRLPHHAAIPPPLLVESLDVSVITSGGPSPVADWSNRTVKHSSGRAGQTLSPSPPQTTPVSSSCGIQQEEKTSSRFMLQPAGGHSPTADSLSSPSAISSGSDASQLACAPPQQQQQQQQQPRNPSASTTAPSMEPSSQGTNMLDTAIHAIHDETSLASRRGGSGQPSLDTPATVSQTPEQRLRGPDLSPYTASPTSIGETMTPPLPHGPGTMWLCDVSREDDGEDVLSPAQAAAMQRGGVARVSPPHNLPPVRSILEDLASDSSIEATSDRSDGDQDALEDSRSSLRRSLFPHATAAYVSGHPSAEPFSSNSTSAFLSPLRTRETVLDRGFGVQYPLFQPHNHSPYQAGLPLPPAQATPSHTDLLTNVFAETATGGGATLPNFASSPRADGGHSPLQSCPEVGSLHRRSRDLHTDAPMYFTQSSPLRLSGVSTQQMPSPSSCGTEMRTQVFQSGPHGVSPLSQRCRTTPSRRAGTESIFSMVSPHKHTGQLFCSPPRTAATPLQPSRTATNTVTVPTSAAAQRPSMAPTALLAHLLDEAVASVHSQTNTTTCHSSPRTPHNVSSVVTHHTHHGASGRSIASAASSPTLPSFVGSCAGRSLSLSGAPTGPAVIAELVDRSDTPTSPHTPPGNRTPGIAGLVGMGGSSYATMSEHSIAYSQHRHRQMPSQPMTPQKSARRTFSRQTTPSQSFRSKVRSHSFESQQQAVLPSQSNPGAHMDALWSASGQGNTSVMSAMYPEATAITASAAAERDYLAPSRNPFSVYRDLEVYATASLSAEENRFSGVHDSSNRICNSTAMHTAASVDTRLSGKRARLIDQLTSVCLRPDAAVVLYEQLIPAPHKPPRSHPTVPREGTPAHAALDLKMHARAHGHANATPGSLSLSLSGRGAAGLAWGNPAASRNHQAKETATEVLSTLSGRSGAGSPLRRQAAVTSVSERPLTHTDVPLKGILMHATKPRITLANCSPRRGPPFGHAAAVAALASPPCSPSRAVLRQGVATILEVPPDCSVSTHRHPLEESQPHASSPSSPITTAPTAVTRNSSVTFASLDSEAVEHPWRHKHEPASRSDVFSRSHDTHSEGERSDDVNEDEAPSPPPRRPTTRFLSSGDSSPNGSPLGADRALEFGADATDTSGIDERHEGETAPQSAGAEQALHSTPITLDDMTSPLEPGTASPLAVAKEESTDTLSSVGSPSFLQHTVANLRSLADMQPSPMQLQLGLHPTPHRSPFKAETTGRLPLTLPPSACGSASPVPLERLFDLLRSPDRPSPQLSRQPTPSRDAVGLRISADSNWAHRTSPQQPQPCQTVGTAASAAVVEERRSGSVHHDAASVLSSSAYQALSSALDHLETTNTSEGEEIAGDRFQAHHEFQFMHYVHTAVGAAASAAVAPPGAAVRHADDGRPIALAVEVNGVTWLALHRLNGLPYAVKEVPAVAFNTAELRCLTLSNTSYQSDAKESAAAGGGPHVHPRDVLEAEDYLARYYSVTTPPQDSAKPVVHLLQLEYFPRGSVHEAVCQARSNARSMAAAAADSYSSSIDEPPSLLAAGTRVDCAFWERVVQQGLRGLRALHTAHLLHGCPLPSCLFLAGRSEAAVNVKWSCFGSARANAEVYPTEALPTWLSEAVTLLYQQWRDDGNTELVLAETVEVAVFCLGVLELMVEEAEGRGGMYAAPQVAAAAEGLCRLEWIEAMVRRNDGRHASLGPEATQRHYFMRFLWDTANGYRSAEEVLAQMGVCIHPALHTVTELYICERDRLARLLRERQFQRKFKKLQQQQRSHARLLSHDSSIPSSDHDHVAGVLSHDSEDLAHPPQYTEEGRSRPTTPALELAAVPPGENKKTPQLCARPASGVVASRSHHLLPRALHGEVTAERNLPSLGAAAGLFLPHTTASARSSEASAALLSLRGDQLASDGSARGVWTGCRRKADVHPQVREAARAMLLNALAPDSREDAVGFVTKMWRRLLRPAVHSLRLRGWMSLYGGVPLSVTTARKAAAGGGGSTEGEEEEDALVSLLMALRPLSSFE